MSGARRRLAPLLLVVLAACTPSAQPRSAPHELLGKPIELTLPTDHGQLGVLPARGAPVTVVDFFGPTCAPCAKTLPALLAKKAEIEGAGGRLVLVAVLADSETTEDARKALSAWGVGGVSFLVDTGDASKREAGVRTLPTTLVLDAKGVVRWSAPPDATPADVVSAVLATR